MIRTWFQHGAENCVNIPGIEVMCFDTRSNMALPEPEYDSASRAYGANLVGTGSSRWSPEGVTEFITILDCAGLTLPKVEVHTRHT